MTELWKLFEPIKIGKLELKNRIMMNSMSTGFGTDIERHKNFYVERAKGGVALIILGSHQVLYPGMGAMRGADGQDKRDERRIGFNLYDDSSIAPLAEIIKAIHQAGAKAAPNIATYGYWAKDGKGTPFEGIGPSEVSTVRGEPPCRPLTVAEIHQIEELIGDAAVRAQRAEADLIYLLVVGGNLLCRFLSLLTNKRTDEYGGSLENRARFLLEIIAGIKRRVGDDYPLMVRLSGEDFMPGGLTIEDWKPIAVLVEKAGAHAIDMMPGWHESRHPLVQMSVPRGAYVYIAEEFKKVVNIPVVASQRINDPILAEQILVEGKADLIGIGRPLFADPEFPQKAREGRLDDIVPCIACCYCFETMSREGGVACAVNPRAGREAEYTIEPTKQPKKVLVFGGGPGGMETARVAALRGHQVTLSERSGELGGQLLLAVVPPHKGELTNFKNYLANQVKKQGVQIRLGDEVTLKSLAESKPDVVVLATGATPLIPDIPGVSRSNVVTALDVLAGRKEVGPKAVIIGGGMIGCETAEFLVEKGKRVTILEMLPRIANDMGQIERFALVDRLRQVGINIVLGANAEEITDSGVSVSRDGSSEFFEADTVALAMGMRPNDALAKQLESKTIPTHLVGDCVEPRRIAEAIKEGFQVGLEL